MTPDQGLLETRVSHENGITRQRFADLGKQSFRRGRNDAFNAWLLPGKARMVVRRLWVAENLTPRTRES